MLSKAMTVNLPVSVLESIKSMSETLEVNQTEVVRQAIKVFGVIARVRNEGGTLLIENKDKTIRQLEFL